MDEHEYKEQHIFKYIYCWTVKNRAAMRSYGGQWSCDITEHLL